MQVCCSPMCAIEYAKTDAGKKAVTNAKRKETRERKEKLKTKSDWTKQAQKSFNAYIRERDRFEPCISCGKPADGRAEPQYRGDGGWDCGHYRSVGACPELRFEPLNAHKQCVKCNQHKSGNVVEYRIKLIERIGQRNLNWLEGHHNMPHLTTEGLKAIDAHYKSEKKKLIEQREKGSVDGR